MYHLHSIKEITSDEHKTLTKISTRNLSRQFPQTSAHIGHDKIRNKRTGEKHHAPYRGYRYRRCRWLEVLDPEIRIPTEKDFVLPPPLESLLDKAKMAYKFLPKQGDIDRLIAKINKKVLRDTDLCVDLRDLKAAYLTSPHFRDIYLHLLLNRMPLGKGASKRLDQNARNYLILDDLLFKILEIEKEI